MLNNNKTLLGALALWLVLLSGVAAAAVETATMIDVATIDKLALTHQLELLEDPSAKLSLEQVLSDSHSGQFSPIKGASNFGFSSSAWWLRFALRNEESVQRTVILRQDYPLIDYIELWALDSAGRWTVRETGDQRPFAQRELEHREFVFELDLAPRSEATYYLRFRSSGPINIGLSLHSQQNLISYISKSQLAYGIYYGGFLVLVLYNLFIFLVVRDRPFFYYLLYVISYGLYFAVHNGLTYQFLWPTSPWWGNQSLIFLLGLTLIWGLQFSRKFLNMHLIAPRLDRSAVALQILLVGLIAASLFLPYALVIVPFALFSLIVTALILIMGSAGLLAGYRPANYFMVAWTALLVGVIVYMLKTFGWLPHNFFTHNAFQVGSLIEMVLLSLALASRVNELQKETRTDALTTLFNRRHFSEKLATEFDRAKRYQQPLALLMIDIDHFKQFNDRFGHAQGDEALRMVARQLRSSARRQDIACRYGGEEFSMILPSTDLAAAGRLAERLRQSIERQRVGKGALTISVGIASLPSDGFANADEFFEAADQALYKAKSVGRNRVVSFEPALAAG